MATSGPTAAKRPTDSVNDVDKAGTTKEIL